MYKTILLFPHSLTQDKFYLIDDDFEEIFIAPTYLYKESLAYLDNVINIYRRKNLDISANLVLLISEITNLRFKLSHLDYLNQNHHEIYNEIINYLIFE